MACASRRTCHVHDWIQRSRVFLRVPAVARNIADGWAGCPIESRKLVAVPGRNFVLRVSNSFYVR